MSEPAVPPDSAPPPPPVQGPRRGSMLRRLVPVAIGVGAAVLFNMFFMPQPVDLLLRLPSQAGAFDAIDVRITRATDDAEVLRARRRREPGAKSVVVATKLRKGEYRLAAWPTGADARTMQGAFAYDGGEAVDVALSFR